MRTAALVFLVTLAAQPQPGAGVIEGRVLNGLTGAPLRKATVILTAPKFRLNAETDPQGKFQFFDLPPGTYRLTASHGGFLDRPARRPVSVAAGDHAASAEIRLPPQGTIAGRVLDQDGDPIDEARVWLIKQAFRHGSRIWNRVGSAVQTNDDGEYRLADLASGRYLVQAYNYRQPVANHYGSPPTAFYVSTYYPNALTQQQAVPVDVTAGAESRHIDIRLAKMTRPPTVHVRGKVIGIRPESEIVVSIGLVPADGSLSFGDTNMLARPPDYAFDLSTVPGQYYVVGNVYSSSLPNAYITGSLTVTGAISGVTFPLVPVPDVKGRIILPEGGARLNFRDLQIILNQFTPTRASDAPYPAHVDPTGGFAVNVPLPPGHYELAGPRPLPEGCFIQSVKLNGQEISPDDFELAPTTQLEIILSRGAAKIAGTVVDAEGKPFPISVITLIPDGAKSRSAKQSADDTGAFQFRNLAPGKYKLYAWELLDDDLWQDPDFLKKYESRAAEITVSSGETQSLQLRVIAEEEMK